MPESVDQEPAADDRSTAGTSALQYAFPAILVVVLLLLGAAFDGAFEIKYWAPPTLFALVMLASITAAGGGMPVRPRSVLVAASGLWVLAIVGVASALWASAPALALESGLRTVLYAAVFTLPIVTLRHRASLRATAAVLTVGIALIAVVTLVRLLATSPGVVVAGRLDGPVGYRNATALLFCLGFWPLLTLAARRSQGFRGLRALAFGAATLELGLAFLTQSRGVLLGFGAGALVVVALGPDRVRRAWLALLAVALILAFNGGLLTMYSAFDGGQGVPTDADITRTGVWLLVVTGVATVLGLMYAVLDSGLRPSDTVKTTARASLAVLVVAAVVVGVVKVGDPVAEARTQWDEFTNLQTIATGSTRYFNAGGQRYDLWRIAVNELGDHPVGGVGAGNYAAGFYADRRTDRNLDDPHGLPFQVGAELGVLGLAALAVFLLGLVYAVGRHWRRLEPDDQRLAVAMLATGGVLVGQSLVDWMWRIPGVTAAGIFAAGVGVAVIARAGGPAERERWLPVPARIPGTAVAAVLAVLVVTTFLGDYYVREARAERGVDADRQLQLARRAQGLIPSNLPALYLESSALETQGRVEDARNVLLRARREVPSDFTPLALLGDLEARRGRFDAARGWYRAALAKNPVDSGLRALAVSGGRPPRRSG